MNRVSERFTGGQLPPIGDELVTRRGLFRLAGVAAGVAAMGPALAGCTNGEKDPNNQTADAAPDTNTEQHSQQDNKPNSSNKEGGLITDVWYMEKHPGIPVNVTITEDAMKWRRSLENPSKKCPIYIAGRFPEGQGVTSVDVSYTLRRTVKRTGESDLHIIGVTIEFMRSDGTIVETYKGIVS